MVAQSAVITGIPSTAGMKAGMPVINCEALVGGQTPTILSVDSSTQITLSSAVSTGGTGIIFQVNGLVSFQWRAGTPNAPGWTAFVPDQFELQQDGKAGIIRLYGVMPRLYDNMARVTYWAGFMIDWENAGNNTTHTLPGEISDACENMVVRRFKRRQLAGKGSEAFDGATTAWNREIDSEDQTAIDHYKIVPPIF